MARVIIDPEKIAGRRAALSREEARHAKSVLRLSAGDEVEAFDGRGLVYRARIESLGPTRGVLLLLDRVPAGGTDGPALVLCQGLAKGDKLDLIVQKATELGVSCFSPFVSSRSIPRWDPTQAGRRIERWRRISRESCKQCGRDIFPEIREVTDLHAVLEAARAYPTRLIFWEEERAVRLRDILRTSRLTAPVCCLIGPEGGFSPEEVREAESKGFLRVGLGERILRLDTAALSVLSILQYEMGGLG